MQNEDLVLTTHKEGFVAMSSGQKNKRRIELSFQNLVYRLDCIVLSYPLNDCMHS